MFAFPLIPEKNILAILQSFEFNYNQNFTVSLQDMVKVIRVPEPSIPWLR